MLASSWCHCFWRCNTKPDTFRLQESLRTRMTKIQEGKRARKERERESRKRVETGFAYRFYMEAYVMFRRCTSEETVEFLRIWRCGFSRQKVGILHSLGQDLMHVSLSPSARTPITEQHCQKCACVIVLDLHSSCWQLSPSASIRRRQCVDSVESQDCCSTDSSALK